MLKIAEYRFWIIVIGLIAFCLTSVPPAVSRGDASVDIELAAKKIYFSYATTGPPFFCCAKEQTRPLEHLDDQPGILPDLSGLAIAGELYLLAPVSCAHHTRLANHPIRAPPLLPRSLSDYVGRSENMGQTAGFAAGSWIVRQTPS